MAARLVERIGDDSSGLERQIRLLKEEDLRELAMAWIRAATLLEAEWEGQARRQGGQGMGLARYLEIRLPSPRECESAQRRIRLEAAARQAIVQQLEELISVIARRLNP